MGRRSCADLAPLRRCHFGVVSELRLHRGRLTPPRVLMQKLGVAPPLATIGSDTVRKYKSAFRQPLSDASHDALQLLLGDGFDPIAVNLDMLGLEDEAS